MINERITKREIPLVVRGWNRQKSNIDVFNEKELFTELALCEFDNQIKVFIGSRNNCDVMTITIKELLGNDIKRKIEKFFDNSPKEITNWAIKVMEKEGYFDIWPVYKS